MVLCHTLHDAVKVSVKMFYYNEFAQQEINNKRDELQRVKCSIPNICLVSLHGQIIFVLCFLPSESLLDEDVESGF